MFLRQLFGYGVVATILAVPMVAIPYYQRTGGLVPPGPRSFEEVKPKTAPPIVVKDPFPDNPPRPTPPAPKPQPTPPQPFPDNPPAPKPQPTPPAPSQKSIRQIILDAGARKKWVIIFFTSNSCQWCQKMKKEVFPNVTMPEFEIFTINTDVGNNSSIADGFQVTSLPSYFIFNQTADRTLAKGTGFKNADEFSDWINAAFKPVQQAPPVQQQFVLPPVQQYYVPQQQFVPQSFQYGFSGGINSGPSGGCSP